MMQPPSAAGVVQQPAESWFMPKLCPISWAMVAATPMALSEWSCARSKRHVSILPVHLWVSGVRYFLISVGRKYLLKVFLPISRWVENSTGNIFSLGFRRHPSHVLTAGKKLYIGYWQWLTMFTPPDWKSEHMAITGAKPTVVPLKGTPLKSTQKKHEMALRHWRRQAEKCTLQCPAPHTLSGGHSVFVVSPSAGRHSRATKP